MAEVLSSRGEVTVVAPAVNQSAVGRGLSYGRLAPDREMAGDLDFFDREDDPFTVTIPHEEHELGYAIHGTPCDCVILGVNAFDPDVVVAGCNTGANLGIHVLPRSGTASAAVEAASLGVPGVAVSMDVKGENRATLEPGDFEEACRIADEVIERSASEGIWEHVDYLNVNVPKPETDIEGISITQPTSVYDMHADLADGRFSLHNPLWAEMAAGDIPDQDGTDRHALLHDRVSVSPLLLPRSDLDEEVIEHLDDIFDHISGDE